MDIPGDVKSAVEGNTKEIIGGAVAAAFLFARKFVIRQVTRLHLWWTKEARANRAVLSELRNAITTVTPIVERIDHRMAEQSAVNERNAICIAINRAMASHSLDMSPRPTFLCDASGASIEINSALASLFGRPRADCLGNGWSESIHPEDREGVYRAWMAYTRDTNLRYRYGYRLLVGHEPVSVIATASEIRTSAGELAGFLGHVDRLPSIATGERNGDQIISDLTFRA